MKAGSSALTARFFAIKFIHLVEGRDDFDHKDHRVKSLVEAEKREGNTRQKLPINPELLRWGKCNIAEFDGARYKAAELWDAAITGFHFALSIGE